MASYHMCIKSGKKGSATEHSQYIARQGKHGRDSEDLDLVEKAHGNMPDWASDNPTTFWRAADKYERQNGAAYREFELALPNELTTEQQFELLNEFVGEAIGKKPYQLAIHAPMAALGGVRQPHGHVMFSDRVPDGIDRPAGQHFKRHNPAKPEAGGAKKDSGGKTRIELRQHVSELRELWARQQNSKLEALGHSARVDHRSHVEREIDAAPERHLGQSGVKKMSEDEREAFRSDR